jgi:ATP-binding cassette subfamily F protein uup
MTLLLGLRNAAVTFGGDPLWTGVDLALSAGDKACLVGRNGSGKSTILKALAGTIDLDGGERFVQPGIRIAYLAQEPDLTVHATVADYVASALPADRAHDHWRVEQVLAAVKLDGDRSTDTLSGGEGRRAAIAHAVVGEPDVLLLDEPTNHLDLPTIEWLENELKAWRGALLLISHDRAFLNALVQRAWWIDRGVLRQMDKPFAEFDEWSETILAQEEAERARLDKRIASETTWSRQGISARRKRNQGRLRNLYAMRAERRSQIDRQGVAALGIAEAGRGAVRVIEAEHVSKAYGDTVIVRDFSTRVARGDRIGVIGPNGAGKSSLVKVLTGAERPDSGTVRLGPGVEPAYYDQTRVTLDPETTLRDVLLPHGGDHVQVGDQKRHIASYLGDFLFDSSRMFSPVKSLSGGERGRLLLAKLFARPSNLLILDEPTNDLDLETLDLLEEVLADFQGTLILVSHDRDFLDRLVTSVIAVEGQGRVTEYVGGYTDYLRQRPAPVSASAPAARSTATAKPAAPKPRTKLSFKDQRELDLLPGRIEALTAEIARLGEALHDPGLYARDPDGFARKSARLAAAEAEREAAEERWLELASLAEELGA